MRKIAIFILSTLLFSYALPLADAATETNSQMEHRHLPMCSAKQVIRPPRSDSTLRS